MMKLIEKVEVVYSGEDVGTGSASGVQVRGTTIGSMNDYQFTLSIHLTRAGYGS